MVKNVVVVQIFVASPADVREERDTLESLIREMNLLWGNSLGVIFELVRWETHVAPAFGSDPQAVINDQIPDDYDVFVGILWARFGTPTPRAASGTLEEFERALERRRITGSTPDIMVYFKDAPISPSEIDAEQLGHVSRFRQSLSDRGGLYSVFKDASGFQSSLRAHLAGLARRFSSRNLLPINTSERKLDVSTKEVSITISTSQISEIDDDLGYFDYVDIYNSRMTEMTSTIEVIGDATTKVGAQIDQRAKEVERLTQLGGDMREARKIMKLSAENMSVYAEVLQSNIPLMTSSRKNAFNALANALSVYADFSKRDDPDMVSLHASLGAMMQTASISMTELIKFRSMMSITPKMTIEINKAKRAVVDQLDLMISEVGNTIHSAENIKGTVEAML